MNKRIKSGLERIVASSGLINPERFEVAESEVAPGTLHPITSTWMFPIPIALIVLEMKEGHVVLCPVIVPPSKDREFLPGDRWLPGEHSPFRTLPGTGWMQVRCDWTVTVPRHTLMQAVRRVLIQELVSEPPAFMEPAKDQALWRSAWNSMISAVQYQ